MSKWSPPRTRCPDCGRKTVILALRSNGEDNYYCTYHRWQKDSCHFYFFTSSNAKVDLDNEKRWEEANRVNEQ